MDLYTEIILDHYKSPQHYGRLDKPTVTASEYNVLCGDKIEMDLIVEDGKLKDVGFTGAGCAISQAAVSMISEELIGKTLKEIDALPNEFVFDLLHISISPARVKCALIGLMAVKKAVNKLI